MLTKVLFNGIATTLLVASLSNCGGGSELETPNTGTVDHDGLISQKNFLIAFSDTAPAFLDLAANTTTATTSDVTVSIADNNNQPITVPKTVFFETEWGTFNKPSCETDNTGSCTVTWQTGKINDINLVGFKNTIVAYSDKSGSTGQESFFDANGNGSFNDGETAQDLDEPFINKDDSFDVNGNATFTIGDKIINTINGVDTTGANGAHDAGDGLYNGPNCSHSSLCSTTRAVSTVWSSGSLQLTGADQFTIGGQITGLVGNITIQNNGGDNAIISQGQTTFNFGTSLIPGKTYNVTILEPVPTTCIVSTGTGIVGTEAGGNITTVRITC